MLHIYFLKNVILQQYHSKCKRVLLEITPKDGQRMIRNQEQLRRIFVLAEISCLHMIISLLYTLAVEIDYLAMNNEHDVHRNAAYSTKTKRGHVRVQYWSPLRFQILFVPRSGTHTSQCSPSQITMFHFLFKWSRGLVYFSGFFRLIYFYISQAPILSNQFPRIQFCRLLDFCTTYLLLS